MVLCGFIILIHWNWLLFGFFFVLYFALFGSVFHLLLDKCRMYVNIYHIYRNLSREVWCGYMYNRDNYKVSKTNGAIIGGRGDPHAKRFNTWLFLFWNLMMFPRGHLLNIRWTALTQGTHLFSSIWVLPVQKTVKAHPRGPWTIKPFFSCYE